MSDMALLHFPSEYVRVNSPYLVVLRLHLTTTSMPDLSYNEDAVYIYDNTWFGVISELVNTPSNVHTRMIITQSFQVEGPQNREISRFIGNTIGRFLWELFKAETQSVTAAIMSCSINRTSVIDIDTM